jgi:hypothetical protein
MPWNFESGVGSPTWQFIFSAAFEIHAKVTLSIDLNLQTEVIVGHLLERQKFAYAILYYEILASF